MDSRQAYGRWMLGFALRTLAVAGLAFVALEVLASSRHYATAAVLSGLTAFTIWDTARHYRTPQIEREGVGDGERALLQRLQQATALLDSVGAALLAINPDGRVSFANRAARRLARGQPTHLNTIAPLAGATAEAILALPPGAHRIVTLADGRSMLAGVASFTVPRSAPQRLISLQAIAGELEAVQLGAWQDLSRVLAHEIMNSLTPIASLSESVAALLEERPDADPQVAHGIKAVARRSGHLIDFVDRYRRAAELPEARLRQVRLADLIDDIDALMAPDLARQGVAFRRRVQPPDLTVAADPELLSQAVLNLLHNAAEAVAGRRDGAVDLICEATAEGWTCRVADNGPGMPPDRLEQAFVPFFTTKAGGSGIGLTLTRQIALAHGGRIDARNGAEGGAVLTMSLPTVR